MMILRVAEALGGHAGDTGAAMMPHEVAAGMVILAGIGLALIVLAAAAVWLLVRIERHLRKLR